MNKISVKNFKAFGENEQTFSDKKITLIYGANSIGKSSLIHSLIYAKSAFISEKSNIQGLVKELDIGDFKNFIHKHDTDRKFEFTQTIDGEHDLNDFKKIVKMMIKQDKNMTNGLLSLFKPLYYKKFNMHKNNKTKDEAFGKQISSKLAYSIDEIIDICNNNKKEDEFKTEIKKYKDYTSDNIDTIKTWYKEILDYTFGIRTVSLKLIVGYNNKKIELYFNNELYAIVNYNSVDNNYKIELSDNENSVYKNIAKEIKYSGIRPKGDFKFYLTSTEEPNYINNLLKNYNNSKGSDSDLLNLFLGVADIFISGIILHLIAPNRYEGLAIYYCAPLRHYPERNETIYDFKKDENKNLTSTKDIWKLLAKCDSNTDELRKMINRWLSNPDNLVNTYEIGVEKIEEKEDGFYRSRFFLKDLTRNIEVHNRDVGLGITQMIPILFYCYNDMDYLGRKGEDYIFIEQPELHLNPKQQCQLMDTFIETANRYRHKIYIETHSEHMLLRLLRRIKRTNNGNAKPGFEISPDDVCVLSIEKNDKTNETQIVEMEISDDGELLTDWPKGFFDDLYNEKFDVGEI